MNKPNYDQISYFHQYGKLERMSDWKEQLDLLKKHHPEVAEAYKDLVNAKKTFDLLVKIMLDNAEY